MRRTTEERFWSKVDTSGGPDACWPWIGYLHPEGYGQFWFEKKVIGPHVAAYRMFVGPIPDGFTVDHLCRSRSCCNPAHLEAVTRGENVLRGESFSARNARLTHCVRGHRFIPANTRITRHGYRRCRACDRESKRVAQGAA